MEPNEYKGRRSESYKSKKDEILIDIVKNIEVGFKVSNEEIITAEKIRQDLFIKVDKFFEEYDF